MMDVFNNKKIAELEKEIASLKLSNEAYKLRNEQIEKSEIELQSAKLKIEVMQMLINDDEAVLELLAAKKVKDLEEKKYSFDAWESAQANQAQALGFAGGPWYVCINRWLK